MSRLVPASTVEYMVHVWGHGPIVMTKKRAKDLMKKHGGSYHWHGKTCHVYLSPDVEVTLRMPKIKEVSSGR